MNSSSTAQAGPVNNQTEGPSGLYVWGLRIFSGVALCLSCYLAWTALTAQPVYGCGGGSTVFDCGHVMTSHWAKVAGVPVSIPAFALYSIMLSALLFCRHGTVERIRQVSWTCITACGIAAGLAALWFVGLQVFVLEHLCPWCLAAHSCGILIAAMLIWKRPLGLRVTCELSGVSLVGTALMIAAQYFSPAEQKFEEITFDDVSRDTTVVVDADPGHDAISLGDDFGELFAAPGAAAAASDDSVFEAPGSATSIDLDEDESIVDPSHAATLLLLFPRSFQVMNQLLPPVTFAVAFDEAAEPAADSEVASEE